MTTLANTSAVTAMQLIAQTKIKSDAQATIGKTNITVCALEGILIAASTAIQSDTVAINTFNKCNQQSYDAMKYLNDITILGTTALHTLAPH